MIFTRTWISFCSQTGTEIVQLSKELNIRPSLVVTTDFASIALQNIEWFNLNKIPLLVLPYRPQPEHYKIIPVLKNSLFTLHGYLRIIPSSFLKRVKGNIFNGHPGLITKYPELRGLNPQAYIWFNSKRYLVCGSVVHCVTSELDLGEILVSVQTKNISFDSPSAYQLLRQTSFEAWKIFFKKQLYENNNRSTRSRKNYSLSVGI